MVSLEVCRSSRVTVAMLRQQFPIGGWKGVDELDSPEDDAVVSFKGRLGAVLSMRKGKSSAFVDGRCYQLLGVSLQIGGATGAPLAHDVLRSGDGTPRLGPPSRKHPPCTTRIAMGQTQLELRGRRRMRESSSTITGADPASGEVCRSPHRAGDGDETGIHVPCQDGLRQGVGES